jgi:cytochrome P450
MHGLNPMDPAIVADPGLYTALSRASAPVFFVPEAGMYMVTRYHDIVAIVSDWRRFHMPPFGPQLQVPEEVAARLPEGFAWQRPGFMPTLLPPEHSRVRKLAQRAFTRKTALASEPKIRELCNSFVDRFVDDGEVDLITAYTRQIPVRVIATILGVDLAEAPKMYQWALDVLRVLGDPTLGGQDVVDIAHRHADFEQWCRDLITERRRELRGEDDLVSNLLRATTDDGEPRLSDMEIFSIILVAVFGGSDTSAGAMAQIMHRMLSADGELYDRALRNRSLLPKLLEEELRYDSVGHAIFRVCAEDVELHGVAIPAGSVLALHTWSSGHDQSAFVEPERFDPDRSDVDDHLGWGRGIHFCLGAPLAKVEVTVAIGVLLDRLPNLRLVDGHEMKQMPSIGIPSWQSGLVVAWNV